MQDSALDLETNFTLEQICNLPDLCLFTEYFKYNNSFCTVKHGSGMGSSVSLIGANLYMEEAESRALSSFI